MYYLKSMIHGFVYAFSVFESIINPVCSSKVIMSYKDGKKTIETLLVKKRFGNTQKIQHEWISTKETKTETIPYIHVNNI